MGLLGKLFEKKNCDVCGAQIGLLGNRKLADGNLCKECAGKLSPFFDDRRGSTVEQIKEQLAYREKNKQAVAAFHTTRTYGSSTKIYFDDNAGCFMVTRSGNFAEANPDVIPYSAVTSCNVDIDEMEKEVKRTVKDAQGNSRQESYNPPRYEYSYDFNIEITVNSPYFDYIKFSLSDGYFDVREMSTEYQMQHNMINSRSMIGNPVEQGLMNALNHTVGNTGTETTDPRMMNSDYAKYYNWSEEIRQKLSGVSGQASAVSGPQKYIFFDTATDAEFKGGSFYRYVDTTKGINTDFILLLSGKVGYQEVSAPGASSYSNEEVAARIKQALAVTFLSKLGKYGEAGEKPDALRNHAGDILNDFNSSCADTIAGIGVKVTSLTIDSARFRDEDMKALEGLEDAAGAAADPAYAEKLAGQMMAAQNQALAANGGKMRCPVCGAETTPDTNGKCEFCRTRILL